MASKKRVIVVGGGLAGLACTIKLAEEGVAVDLISMVPVKRSHSVCAQGGINACNEIARQQGYSEWEHFEETALGGDFLADQPPVLEMTSWAPKIIDLLTRMGVPFNRTPEGQRALRLFGGSLFKRTFFAGATTASSCFTRWMSRRADGNRKAKLRSTNSGNFSGRLFTMASAWESSRRICERCRFDRSAVMQW